MGASAADAPLCGITPMLITTIAANAPSHVSSWNQTKGMPQLSAIGWSETYCTVGTAKAVLSRGPVASPMFFQSLPKPLAAIW